MLKTTGRYNAFDLKWHPSYGKNPTVWPIPNHLFWDSDVAKWLEALAYFHAETSGAHKSLEEASEDLSSKICSAQQKDGYLNIHFTVVDRKGRFSNMRDLHELYNAGHLIEAALALQGCCGSDDLLKCLEKYVDLIHATFGPENGQKRGYDGHPEIELALIRLHRRTGSRKAVELARFFLTERGSQGNESQGHYFDVEAVARGEGEHVQPAYYPAPRSYWYQQAHKPILEQDTIEGHSVRAAYLLTAVADMAILDPEDFGLKYVPSIKRLWRNMVDKKMYLTGGIGAISQWEGFGREYFLPQSTEEGGCYSETCAAIGVIMLAERLLQIDLDGEYADVLERSLFNAVLTGMSVDGKAFTYINQLATCDESPSNRREEWFECACCPPNVARVLGHLGGYLWTVRDDTPAAALVVNVHLYASALLEHTVGDRRLRLTQTTEYPWQGEVAFHLETDLDDVQINLRIPGWALDEWQASLLFQSPDAIAVTRSHCSQLEPAPPHSPGLVKGYLALDAAYLRSHPRFSLSLPMRPRLLRPHPYTNQRIAAVARGPLVYCLEDVDNSWVNDHFKSLVFEPDTTRSDRDFVRACREEWRSDLPLGEGYMSIVVDKGGVVVPPDDGLEAAASLGRAIAAVAERVDLKFIPYWARANRGGKHMMRVGIRTVD
ncbi:hypothetical protein ANO11243_034670 [Dothideomycetidae sp. 11243]|nr:hypothetical protein ANO11243_034670 [fungal sp. No.11243]